MAECVDVKIQRGGKKKINSYCSIRKYFFTVDTTWWKRSALLLLLLFKCYWFVHVCRPQNIMVCLGKRCKAKCTFSAEKYTGFTVWKLPPPPPPPLQPFMCSLTTNETDQSSSSPQTSGSFKTPLRSLSVHYQSMFIVTVLYSCDYCLRPRTLLEASVTKATVPTGGGGGGGSFPLSLWDAAQTMPEIPPHGNYIQNVETIPASWELPTRQPSVRHVHTQAVSLCGAWSANLTLD